MSANKSLIREAVDQRAMQIVNWSVSRSVSQSVSQSVIQPANQSVSQSVSQPVRYIIKAKRYIVCRQVRSRQRVLATKVAVILSVSSVDL